MIDKYIDVLYEYLDLFPGSRLSDINPLELMEVEKCIQALQQAIKEQTTIDNLKLRKLWGYEAMKDFREDTNDGVRPM